MISGQDKSSVDGILSYLKEAVEERRPLTPRDWLESAARLNILHQDLQEELIEAEMAVALLKYAKVLDGSSVAAAQVIVETSDAYKKVRLIKAKETRVIEHIRIAKQISKTPDF